MIDADKVRERFGAPSRMCHCGRMETGKGYSACRLCFRDSAAAFWALRDGAISAPAFYRRLRKTTSKGN